jgi:hypothetical protein
MTDIAELFARDPMKLTKEDIGEIVKEYRKMRGQFNLGNKSAGSTKPPTVKQKETLDLAKALGLDIKL